MCKKQRHFHNAKLTILQLLKKFSTTFFFFNFKKHIGTQKSGNIFFHGHNTIITLTKATLIKISLFAYLVVVGFSCGTWDLRSS